MKKRLSSLVLLLILMLLSPCSLDHYVANPQLKIKAEFPKSLRASTENLNRPAGTDDTYVPQFIERITLKVFQDATEIASAENNRDSGTGLVSNEINLEGSFEYGTYNFQAEAFICKTPDCLELHKTHEASFDYTLTSSNETTGIPATFEIQTGQIDDDPYEIPVAELASSADNPPYRPYCLALNDNGYFTFGWLEDPGSNYGKSASPFFRTYDGSANLKDSLSGETLITNAFVTGDKCIWYPDKIYLPIVTIANEEYNLSLLTYRPDSHTIEKNNISLGPDDTKKAKIDPYIDVAHGSIAIAWSAEEESTTDTAYVITLNEETKALNFTTPSSGFCDGSGTVHSCSKPKVKIIDEKIFAALGISKNYSGDDYSSRITGRKGIIQDPIFLGSAQIYLSPQSFGESGYPSAEFDLVFDNDSNFAFSYLIKTPTTNPKITATYVTMDILPGIAKNLGTGTNPEVHPAVAMKNPDEFYAAWVDDGTASDVILYRKLASDGSPSSGIETASLSAILPEIGPKGNPKIAINSDGFGVISWYKYSGTSSPAVSRIEFKRFMF